MMIHHRHMPRIVALRNEKGSYNSQSPQAIRNQIVALRNEKGSYNSSYARRWCERIVALRNEKGSYNHVCATVLS